MSKKRDYCFTVNNLQLALQEGRSPWDIDRMCALYMAVQQEIGDNGTPHYQGFVQFKTNITCELAKSRIGYNCHLEVREGTVKEAADYCRLPEYKGKNKNVINGPWEAGVMQSTKAGQGQRTDIRNYRDAIKTGKRNRELCEAFPAMYCKYPKYVHSVRLAYHENYYSFRSVYLHVGETGLGKTKWIYENEDQFWKMPIQNGTNWYDNYQGDKTVLLDDFSGGLSKVGLTSLLRLLDGYSDIVPVKSSFCPWTPDKIYITTNIWPNDWYDYDQPKDRRAHFRALVRRFTVVRHFTEEGIITYDTQRDINDLLDVPPPATLLEYGAGPSAYGPTNTN